MRRAAGPIAGILLVAAFALAMLPFRAHLALATPGLVLVLPVVFAVAAGGIGAGVAAVAAGFLAYDLFFIEPYGTLAVGAAQNWLPLGVYLVVMLVIARVVAGLRTARTTERRRERRARELLELTDVLITDRPAPELFDVVATTIRRALGFATVALLLPPPDSPVEGGLEVVACSGPPLAAEALEAVSPSAGRARSTGVVAPAGGGLSWIPLLAAGRPVGVLAFAGPMPGDDDHELLRTYANHAALAIERSRLAEQVVRSQVAEQGDRWRQALLGAVSHDLRTPLATVKAALSDLRRSDLELGPDDERELLDLAETQADRLDRLVSNLLDMTQIQGGTLRMRRRPELVEELVGEAVGVLGPAWPGRIATSLPLTLPPVDVDAVLVVEALTNLLDNAARHAGSEKPITVAALQRGQRVELAVEDRGPGVSPAEREWIFEMFNRTAGGGRAGLGLAIAKAFVEATGGAIRVDARPGGGARFVLSLPVAQPGDGELGVG